MNKKLISMKNINDYYNDTKKEVILSNIEILTPSVKDFLSSKGVKIIYEQKCSTQKKMYKNFANKDQLIKKISDIVVKEFNIKDDNEAVKIVLKVVEKIYNS